jgi:L-fuculokinase
MASAFFAQESMNVTPSTPLIVLFDVGKTNSKLSLIETSSCKEVWSTARANCSVTTPIGRELDILEIERWLMSSLKTAPYKDRIEAIVPVAHGAAAVWLSSSGEVLAAPDYEDACYESVNPQYDARRDDYAHTYSPNLPLGLNLGRQLLYIQQQRADVFARTAHVLLYPQYWAWRLSGVLASEVTSLGCHTDLWRPPQSTFSTLVVDEGWTQLLPPLRRASDKLGNLTAAIARDSGLDARCVILCGIHDSNASFLKYLIDRECDAFAVVSSGTWTIVMANRGDLACLREDRDMLANVNAFGAPVPTARFMGGREYEAISQGTDVPSAEALADIIRVQAMALPSFASAGPFANRKGELLNAQGLNGVGRASLATLYSALMTSRLIDALGVRSEVLIDGPLASNPLFGALLAAMIPGEVKLHSDRLGGARSAVHLAGYSVQQSESLKSVEPLNVSGLDRYRAVWEERSG